MRRPDQNWDDEGERAEPHVIKSKGVWNTEVKVWIGKVRNNEERKINI